MRTVPAPLQNALARRPLDFTGERQLVGRVTVERDWWLNLASSNLGVWPPKKKPIRYWQTAANDQDELEIPGIMTITRDASVDNLARTCDITILNQKMNSNDGIGVEPTEVGNPGWLTWNRGRSPEAQARWGQYENEWKNVLIQNALVRVYQGIAGPSPEEDIEWQVANGYLMLRFVGLVDDVNITTDAKITLKCRGMAGGLLVDQKVKFPLLPREDQPYVRARWAYTDEQLRSAAKDVTSTSTTALPPGDRPCTYYDSSTDWWSPTYGGPGPGSNWALHGHYPADALDANFDTFWLSNGDSRPDALFAYNWIEFDCAGEAVDAIYVAPWMGDFTMFVSVLEHGVWQGIDQIPYNPDELYGTQVVVDTGANIPYVGAYGVPFETPQEYRLPRIYAADRIRITFHNGWQSEWGPWLFRSGVREFRPRISASTSSSSTNVQTKHIQPYWFAAANHPVSGYITVDQFQVVDAFGEARVKQRTSPFGPNNRFASAARMTPTGNGYYVLGIDGRVYTYGDAVHHGDLVTIGASSLPDVDQAADFAITIDGGGYWIIKQHGDVHAFGNAADLVSHVPVGVSDWLMSIERASSGFWIMDTAGHVFEYGGAPPLGDYSPTRPSVNGTIATEFCSSLRATSTGAGYWILTSIGNVSAFGDAPDVGGATPLSPLDGDWLRIYWELLPAPGDNGFFIMQGNGTIVPVGSYNAVDYYGGPAQGFAELRSDGSYLDLYEVWRDLLLYAGYFLFEEVGPTDDPQVFGVLETTGTWVNDVLNADLFDKKSVIDAITQLTDIVGYICREGDDGSILITSPNWWQSGNFNENSQHSGIIPEVDERINMTALAVRLPARPVKSPIVIASSKIDPLNPSATMHVEYEPPYAGLNRGMCRDLTWVNGGFTEQSEMQIMAELISLQIWFQLRVAQADCWADPAVEPDTQVRLLERQTSETAIHYVRSVNDTMTLGKTGTWTMRLTTNWLGTHEQWAITADNVDQSEEIIPDRFHISYGLRRWLRDRTGTIRQIPDEWNVLEPRPPIPPYVPPPIPPTGTGPAANGASLIWSQDFAGAAGEPFDPAEWNDIEGPANAPGGTPIAYCPTGTTHVALDGAGHGVITMRRQSSHGYAFTSGRVESRRPWRTGYLEIRAKAPTWPGAAPGLWTMGATSPTYPSGSAYDGSNDFIELDLLEIKTQEDPYSIRQNIHGDFPDHHYPNLWDLGFGRNKVSLAPNRPGDAFHTYGVWVDGTARVVFYVDHVVNHIYLPSDMPAGGIWPYGTKDMVVVLDIEVGGYSGYPDGSRDVDLLIIDYARLFNRPYFN